ncbi:hypothetical protein JXL83_08595 [candidate division WOR-3 bacterium]|nr:hypothetical protein [candidate division WOR-3 bacterium]
MLKTKPAFLVLYIFALSGCSVPGPVDLGIDNGEEIPLCLDVCSDTLRVIIMNNSSLFQAVASSFYDQNSREIDSFLSLTGRIYIVEKANSFFAPPESSATYILYSLADEEDSSQAGECIDFFCEIFLRKYLLNINASRCVYFSPGRIFFRPALSFSSMSSLPYFIHAACRSIERERGSVWPRHRKEWDENILFMSRINKISVASSRSEESMPQYMNVVSYPSFAGESLASSIPSVRLREDRIIVVLGKDAGKALGFR